MPACLAPHAPHRPHRRSLPDLYDEKELTGYLMAEYAHDEEGDAALHSVDRIAAAVGAQRLPPCVQG